MTLYEYDYDHRIVTEYERHGACHQCGDCCRAAISFRVQGLPPGAQSPRLHDGGPATTGAGVWQVYVDEDGPHCYQTLRIMPGARTCPSLDCAGRCSIYAARNLYCQRWPFSPADVAAFPRCGFSFTPVHSWPLSDAPEEP